MANFPKEGDVIISKKFAFGYYNEKARKVVIIDGKTTKHPVTFVLDEEARVRIAAKTGKITPKERTEDLGAYDRSRAFAEFIVESASMQGGGTGMGPHDIYPDGWHVQARRLNPDGSYNPKGEQIEFYMSGCFTCMVESKDIKIARRMEKKFA